MDSIREWRRNAYHKGGRLDASYVSNREFVASCNDNLVKVFRTGSEEQDFVWSTALQTDGNPILSLSQVCTTRLSTSISGHTTIYDISLKSPQIALISNERTITSAAWSAHDGDVLATGHIDGRVCIWDVKQPSRPTRTFPTGLRPCHQLTWSTVKPQVLAAGASQYWQLWHVGSRPRALNAKCGLDAKLRRIRWHPLATARVLTLDIEGNVVIWETREIIEQSVPDPEDEVADEIFGEPEGIEPERRASRVMTLNMKSTHAAWLGLDGLLLLTEQGRTLQLFQISQSPNAAHDPVWQEDLQTSMNHFELASKNGETTAVLFGHSARSKALIPKLASERFEVRSAPLVLTAPAPEAVGGYEQTKHSANSTARGFMKPKTICALKAERAGFSETSKQLQHRRQSSHPSPTSRPTTSGYRESPATAIPATPPGKAMTSSLELPKLEPDESPMPFLSPTIPSRNPSPTVISPLGEALHLPSISHESFEPLATIVANDSDSDDETFDGHGMHGSGNLVLPGGVNVPLPKSCGALFAPNGQLVTYFPPQLRLRTSKSNALASEQGKGPSSKAMGRFSAFGNLQHRSRDADDSSDSESSGSWDDIAVSDIPGIDLQPPSFPGAEIWPMKLVSAKSTIHRSPSQQTINISVREIDATYIGSPDPAEKYRILCRAGETGAELCIANAGVAKAAGLGEDAEAWHVLTRLLSSDAPVDLSGLGHDRLRPAQSPGSLVRSDSGIELRPSSGKTESLAKMRFADSKLGSAWAVDELFAWAETTADVQMLACMSAILTPAIPTPTQRELRAELSLASKLATNDPNRPVKQRSPTGTSTQPRPVPVLRNDSRDFFHQSPAKLQHTSHTSSRNPSQPTTPFLDSTSGTPPYPFPNLSRQGSRLSTSGSASPEHHRSSFSAAAKYYAQSITEKFSSYGTSPPTKRLGTSPGNELSSSLPLGSWSKSVSFASTVDTTRDSTRSRGVTLHEDEYDSDRTVEDLSLPHTPKIPTGPLFMRVKRSDSFSEYFLEYSRTVLMSPALAAKAQIWMAYYAEQLRCWDMLIEAAELEKIAGINLGKPSVAKHQGVFPVPAAGKRKAICGVCLCKIESIEHFCPECLHTMHLSCLENFIDSCEPDEFECPMGCGCVCSLVPYEDVVWEAPTPPPECSTAERRWSSTDPRVWRSKIENESW